MKPGWVVCLVLFTSTAYAAPNLPCAVEGMNRGVKPAALCQALGTQLERTTELVDDARGTHKGEAIEIITGDVAFTLVWLVDGHVRTWTRVSKTEPLPEQVKLLARAARELAKQAKTIENTKTSCLHVDPVKSRNPDLSYPWTELSPCKRKFVEVVDPWWRP